MTVAQTGKTALGNDESAGYQVNYEGSTQGLSDQVNEEVKEKDEGKKTT